MAPSLQAPDDASPTARACGWCRSLLEVDARPYAVFCGRKCRQAAHRVRRRRTTVDVESRPMRMAYADPPYPGLSAKYYRNESTYAGEVDHRALTASLAAGFDGWALSTSSKALRDVLPLCPAGARVCAWTKPIGVPWATFGPHSTWEPLIVVPGRRIQPGKRDWLSAQPARGGGSLPGRKPIAFCAWLFDLLGLLPGDELVDLFPGTGIVGRAWAEVSRTPSAAPGASPRAARRASLGAGVAQVLGDASAEYSSDGPLFAAGAR